MTIPNAGISLGLIYLLLFLLPGLLAVGIFRVLAEARPLQQFDVIVLGFALTLIANLMAYLFGVSMLPDIRVSEDRVLYFAYENLTAANLAAVTGFSVVLSLMFSWLHRQPKLWAYLRWCGLTNKTGRIDVWHDFHEDNRGTWLEVKLKDGQILTGWARFYSTNHEQRELYLNDVTLRQLGPNGVEEVPLGDDGVYLGNFDEIVFVRVIKPLAGEHDEKI